MKTTVRLRDMADFGVVSEVHQRYFRDREGVTDLMLRS